MLFNSYPFIFVFLPLVFLCCYTLAQKGEDKWISYALIAASLFFYGWWKAEYILLILISVTANYWISEKIRHGQNARQFMWAGIVFNLGLICYFKYTFFFVENVNYLAGTGLVIGQIILPLGISFFTFQQIEYLVDTFKGNTKKSKFSDYLLFVTFFPQLIAGPIVKHNEVLPQIKSLSKKCFSSENIAHGLGFFIIGLFKKVVIADSIAHYATPVFQAAAMGETISFAESWIACFAYTFQLYFDFSGYCDMAIGLGLLFGIRLPINFNSPYKSVSIIDFWRRWHITLSRFLREYLYIPLGGNRTGKYRQLLNLGITMFLGGLWHGAGWTFIIWGMLHGAFLIVTHTLLKVTSVRLPRSLGVFITFFVVALFWVMFRAENIDAALTLYQAMFSFSGFDLNHIQPGLYGFSMLAALFFIIWLLPNSNEIMSYCPYGEKIEPKPISWRPDLYWAVALSCLAVLSIISLRQVSEFLYFQF